MTDDETNKLKAEARLVCAYYREGHDASRLFDRLAFNPYITGTPAWKLWQAGYDDSIENMKEYGRRNLK